MTYEAYGYAARFYFSLLGVYCDVLWLCLPLLMVARPYIYYTVTMEQTKSCWDDVWFIYWVATSRKNILYLSRQSRLIWTSAQSAKNAHLTKVTTPANDKYS